MPHKLLFISLSLISIIYLIKYKSKKRRNLQFNKLSMIEWMQMSNSDRQNSYNRQRIDSMNRKKMLLKDIRKEYNKIKSR